MKKLCLFVILIVGCSTTHGVKVSGDSKDASPDVSISSFDGGKLNYCNIWCHHLSSNVDASTECENECKVQYFDAAIDDQ